MKLSELQTGESGVIVKVKGHGAFRKRILEMGFVKGKKVTVIKNAPLKDPVEYELMDYKISLRRAEASHIQVITKEEITINTKISEQSSLTFTDDLLKISAFEKRKTINVALIGNPNCGKTTLFNFAGKAREHTGNYSGVTVDTKNAVIEMDGYHIQISDLPGTYSLSAYSPEELYVRNHIFKEQPDVVINVIDSSNLERNLYLTTQLIDMDIKVVAALNMYDELQEKGDIFNHIQLGKMLGIPFVPTVSSKGKGISKLFKKVIEVYEDKDETVRHIHINYGEIIEKSIAKIENQITEKLIGLKTEMSPRFIALKLLEKDRDFKSLLKKNENGHSVLELAEERILKIEHSENEDSETLITDAKYGFIAGALKETYKESPRLRRQKTDVIDTFMTHKLFGIPIFIFFMWVMFETTFNLGEYPQNWIKAGIQILSKLTANIMTDGPLKDLVIDGIIGGVGGVIIFLPNILILFFFISFMEDTGYMARAAFIMDKVMHKIGLHGRSFIPLLMGFGCNVPAIMATRTIEDKNSRLLTMLINPFMSCSARLPVYLLLLAAFFPDNVGTLLFIIYLTGIAIAVIVAKIFKRFLLKGNDIPFVMELPPYRMPTLKSTLTHMWNKASQYLQKMGGIILIASILIWFLGYFPKNNDSELSKQLLQKQQIIEQEIESSNNNITHNAKLKQELNEITKNIKSERQKNSFIGKLGHTIEPVLKPLGFDWKMSISLLTGIAAKEIVISTMSVLYQSNDEDKDLISKLKEDKYEDGTEVFTPLVAVSFLIFTLIYFPCVAVVATIRKESGSWKWTLFSISYTTGLAWVLSFLTYQIGSLFI
ncbi:MAG: ferrous iron transport protein B [Marinilabiliaceae bacterium]|nr:ferrous iron transport protein B [Marinilabiliaceae bacterium]